MSRMLIRNDRIKELEIIDGEAVVGKAVFNPYDMGVYKTYTGIRMQLAKDRQAYDALVKEYNALPKVDENGELDSAGYEKLNNMYQAEMKLSGGIDNIFLNLKNGVDGIFGLGVFDLLTKGHKDEGMLQPLFDAAGPFFDEAMAERNGQIEKAMLNREQRRGRKKD